jgi:hypothetical protein
MLGVSGGRYTEPCQHQSFGFEHCFMINQRVELQHLQKRALTPIPRLNWPTRQMCVPANCIVYLGPCRGSLGWGSPLPETPSIKRVGGLSPLNRIVSNA